jgi:aspartate-semialdehyde dehydrogenase
VPVFHGHSEAVWIETGRPLDPGAARELMRRAPGILVVDEPEAGRYPMPIDAVGRDEVFVGRVRADLSAENGLTMWIVADNLRKGAATNAVEIAELLIRDQKLLKTSWEW